MKTRKGRILVVDDNMHILKTLEQLFKRNVECIECIRKPELALEKISGGTYNLVLLDMNFKAGINTGNEGIYWLKTIKHKYPDLPVMMITAFGNIDLAVRAMKEGADDFIPKPWNTEELITKVMTLLSGMPGDKEAQDNQDESAAVDEPEALLGQSRAMMEVKTMIEKVAGTQANVLLTGENGTGKNLIASMIHQQSEQRALKLISIDLGALSENLFESELFGYTAGAFTDARKDRVGNLELANHSTLFLDEIANISLQQQQKLLSVLQEKKFSRLGSSQIIHSDFRLICATNQDLRKKVHEGLFREDLYYRINTIEIHIPPLRERKSDMICLAEHFVKIFAEKYNRRITGIGESTVENLLNYYWPGNVRQLAHEMEKAVILSNSAMLDFKPVETGVPWILSGQTNNLVDLERQTILRVLEKNRGNMSKSAKELGVSRSTLYVKLERYDIQ